MANLLARLEFIAQSLVRAQSTCPHCESRQATVEKRKQGLIVIRRCQECGLRYTSPIYRSWLYPRFYDSAYSEHDIVTAVPSVARLSELRANGYSGTGKEAAARLAAFMGRLDVSHPHLVELGCSWGYFLDQARSAGFAVEGVEVSRDRAAYAREHLQLTVHEQIDSLRPASADLIYTAHVLEHFTDLRGVFPALARTLKPRGLLAIEVPNIDPRLGVQVYGMMGAVHPLGFDGSFFTRTLTALGFEEPQFHRQWELLEQPIPADQTGPFLLLTARRC